MANQEKSVRDVMTANPSSVSEKDSIRDVAQIMAKQDTGVVPVVNGKKIIGLITDRDIVVRLIAQGKDTGTAKVSDVMSKNVRSVRDDAGINSVIELMTKADIRRVPVVNKNDELVGIVSMGDIAKTNRDGKVGQVVEKISEAPPNN